MKVDWPQIIRDLQERGMSKNHQAVELEVTYSTLQRWSEGSSPRYESGFVLIELHKSVCGTTLTQMRLKSLTDTC
jgi:hypothetical protein